MQSARALLMARDLAPYGRDRDAPRSFTDARALRTKRIRVLEKRGSIAPNCVLRIDLVCIAMVMLKKS
jgi:hypothetical protein